MIHKAVMKTIDKFKYSETGMLNLENRALTYLPTEILKYRNEIKQLNIASNLFRSLPEWIVELKNLEYLNVSNNTLDNIPKFISSFTKLNWLSIANNKLNILPDQIGTLTNLTHLYASKNNIVNISDNFTDLVQLVTLDISNNKLTEIPLFLGLFTSLKRLDLTGNNLQFIPDIFSNLNELSILKLKRNPILDLPISVAFLPKLKEFECDYSRLSEESLYKHYSLAGVQAIARTKHNENVQSEIIEMAEELRYAFLGYLNFFEDYVKEAKGKTIVFRANKHPKGIVVEVEVTSSQEGSEIRAYIIEFIEYLKSETVDVIENVIAVRSAQEIRLLQMELNDLKREFESRIERINFKKDLEKLTEINTLHEKYAAQISSIISQMSGKNFSPAVTVNVDVENKNTSKSMLSITSNIDKSFQDLLTTLNKLGIQNLVEKEIVSVEESINESQDYPKLDGFKTLFEKVTKILSQTKTWLIDTPILLGLLRTLYENVNNLVLPTNIPEQSDLLIAIQSAISSIS